MVWSLISLALNPKAEWSKPRQLYPPLKLILFLKFCCSINHLWICYQAFLVHQTIIHTWPCLSCQLIKESALKATALLRHPQNYLFCIGFYRRQKSKPGANYAHLVPW